MRANRLRFLLMLLPVGLLAGGWYVYERTNSAAIRREIIHQLRKELQGVDVELGSTTFRIFGGISFTDLRLIRKDDPTRTPFLTVPSGVIHHDKEALNNGKLLIRKIELDRPFVRLIRLRDGTWNFRDLFPEGDPTRRTPTFVIAGGAVAVYNAANGPIPILELQGIDGTLVNDPLPQLKIELKAEAVTLGELTCKIGLERRRDEATIHLEVPHLVLGANVQRLIEVFVPEVGEHVKGMSGSAKVACTLSWDGEATPSLHYKTAVELTDCRLEHPRLPIALERFQAKFHCEDGHLVVEKATARGGSAEIECALELLPAPSHERNTPQPALLPTQVTAHSSEKAATIEEEEELPSSIRERLRKCELSIRNLTLGPSLFRRLPPSFRSLQRTFAPIGPIHLRYEWDQPTPGDWTKRCFINPAGLTATYDSFTYPIERMTGSLIQTYTSKNVDRLEIDLVGFGGERPVVLKGYTEGSGPRSEIDLTISGTDIPLDETLVAAFQPKYAALIRSFHARGKGDFVARIRRKAGSEVYDNRYEIDLRDVSMRYEGFPLPLENLQGTLVIRSVPAPKPIQTATARDAHNDETAEILEFRNFQATRPGGRILLSGMREPTLTGGVLKLNIQAFAFPLDQELGRALSSLKLAGVWNTFAPFGRANLLARLTLVERHDPFGKRPGESSIDPRRDLELAVEIDGGAIEPSFFRYILDDLNLKLHYARGKVVIPHFRACHGCSIVTLSPPPQGPPSEVLLLPGGGYYAHLRNLIVNPIVIDHEFIPALPLSVRGALQSLQLRGPIAIQAHHLVITEQPHTPLRALPSNDPIAPTAEPLAAPLSREGSGEPAVYWDGRIVFDNAAFRTGIGWEGVYGQIGCQGNYTAGRLGPVLGNVLLKQAVCAKLPLTNVQIGFRIDADAPEVLVLPRISAKLFGGDVGGEGRLVLGSPLRYDVKLNAVRVRLEELARKHQLGPGVQLEGLAAAQLFLTTRSDGIAREPILEGGGSIDVPNGRILNLPLLLDLLKFLNLRALDRTAFEEAHARFKIVGQRIEVTQLDLYGNAISLGGQGEIDLNGRTLQFEFYTVWSRFMKDWLTTPIGEIYASISRNLFKIEMVGRIGGKVRFSKEAVPSLVDPLRRVTERMQQRLLDPALDEP